MAFCAILLINAGPGWALEQQVVAGAGPSTKIVQLFFEGFKTDPAAQNYKFVIPPKSAKHAGGIKCSDKYVFGRTGRPLNSKEKGLNKHELFLAQIPITIVTGSDVGLKSLSLQQIEDIMAGRIANWKEVGGPDAEIVIAGREQTEALFTILKAKYPFFKSAKFSKVFKKDHQIVNFLKSAHGRYAISFGAKPNFEGIEKITMLSIDGFVAGVSVGLVYDESQKEHQLVKAASEYAASETWTGSIKAAGYLPPSS